jgi:hypothetical protein
MNHVLERKKTLCMAKALKAFYMKIRKTVHLGCCKGISKINLQLSMRSTHLRAPLKILMIQNKTLIKIMLM